VPQYGEEVESESSTGHLLTAGEEALRAGEWGTARQLFEAAGRDAALRAEALEGLGHAATFLDDAVASLAARQQAYRLYCARNDRLGAGRAALGLAYDHMVHGGDAALVRGWLQRARRLLEGQDTTAEFGWLRQTESDVAMLIDRDAAVAREAAHDALILARRLGDEDLEMVGMALEGAALVCLGRVSEGMRLLDEACTAASEERAHGVDARLTACCYVIYACRRARDHGRAARWCEYVSGVARRHRYQFMLSFCRTDYAALLMDSGDWAGAESELTSAIAELEVRKPPWVYQGVCLLAELRRRQGRLAEAADLLDRADRPPVRMLAGPDVLLGRAALALDEGAPGQAVAHAERYLRRVGPKEHPDRVAALEILVRAYADCGRLDDAAAAVGQLDQIGSLLGSAAVRGWAASARGTVAAAEGDFDAARRSFEDAVDHFSASELPYDAARARIELARMLRRTAGRRQEADREARLAAETFERLGATPERAAARRLRTEPVPAHSSGDGLTEREVQVLRLLAVGDSNDEIAEQLVLSLRTVERHISNIYAKIGMSGRVARAAAAAYAHRTGLVPVPR
jgi:ATP/maltotriose-dependent transcriptional regulator MalT